MTSSKIFSAHSSTMLKAAALIESLPYIQQFRNKTIVVKYGGNAMIDEDLRINFAKDVVLLSLIGLNPVVVHGGGPSIDKVLSQVGKKSKFVQGMRVTDEETIQIAEQVLVGQIQKDIVHKINSVGGKAVGLTGRDGQLIQAKQKILVDRNDPDKTLDVGFVGDILNVKTSVIKALQSNSFIPIISPIGCDSKGTSLNINADIVAGKVAEALCAEKLVIMTNTLGVLDKKGELLRNLSTQITGKLFEDGTISGGMIPKISSSLEAVRGGVNSVHIVDGRVLHSLLLEILTSQGIGTMIRKL